jgi:hypothetical protein
MSRCGARAVAAVTLNRSYRRSAVAVPCDGRCRATSYHWSGRRGWADDNSEARSAIGAAAQALGCYAPGPHNARESAFGRGPRRSLSRW